MARKRRSPIAASLLQKSREAALNAVQAFNNPLATFKIEAFIVVMSIAWTYLLHAYYHRHGIEYRYFRQGPKRRKFERTPTGEYRNWVKRADLDEGRRSDGLTTEARLELLRLKREVKRLRMERDILKKAAAWFARESDSIPSGGTRS